ncbi:hypothetical protein ACJ77P_02185 [Syntrophus buswellii]|jgi:ATP-dependent DNA helicase RecG|uniref:hypothetical protein n=1 Tax=Syntrophus buswellii TaxID=43774 RepID=UPI0009D08A6A|nr:MAG: hypothetical protein A4E69_01638 [Syntrophus sp. PtaB.Bin138]
MLIFGDNLMALKILYEDQRGPDKCGTGKGTTYRLSRKAAAILNEGVAYDITRRLDLEAIKVLIRSLLKDRPLRNSDIRSFTDLGRQQVYRIMKELEADGLVYQEGRGQTALWHLKQTYAMSSRISTSA